MTNDLNINDELDETTGAADEVAPKKRGRPKSDAAATDDVPVVDIVADKKIAVTVKRDFWDEAGKRHRKGTVVDLSGADLLDALESGSASRVRD